ncbi:MAG: glycogen synthase GlgA, partial [Planctomycetota bacterium]
MKIVFVASEMVPFSKTGGLADVAGALPGFLAEAGHSVSVFTPYHLSVERKNLGVEETGVRLGLPLGPATVEGRVLRLAGGVDHLRVFFVDAPAFFRREGLYQRDGEDHPDNAERFVYFSRAVLEAALRLVPDADLFHVHDWQAALIPAYLETLYADTPLGRAGTLLTIHNLGYQGLFPEEAKALTGLPERLYHWKALEYFGQINFLKAGVVFADAVNTVSKTYAREIQTEPFGAGLDGVLRGRAEDLFGIVNGIDTETWNPAKDPHLAAPFGPGDLMGKARCREALLEEAGLTGGDALLAGMITRLAPQKGVDLVVEGLADLLEAGLQLVVLGTGDPELHRLLEAAEETHRGKVKAFLTFDNGLAHRIEAGADAFLMPSRYEPCGLNQMMSLRYGTPPIVRRTGGLADTVVDATEENIASGVATGFVFDAAEPEDLVDACARAVETFRNRDAWTRLVETGMAQDWSWARAATEYISLYERIL